MQFKKDETPDRVHGRLLEAVHLSGYTADRAYDEFKWLLRQDRWKSVSPGFDNVRDFIATIDLAEFRFALEQRKDIVQQLAALDAGQRATARLLGVSKETVARDLDLRGTHVPLQANELEQNVVDQTEIVESAGTHVPALTPYYSEAGVTIYHGDCREILPTLDERGLMVTDPPYNVGYHYDDYHDAMEASDYWTFLHTVLRMPLIFIHYPEYLFPLAAAFRRGPEKVVAWCYHANTPKQWRAIAWFGVAPDFSLAKQPYKNPTDKRVRALIERGSEGRDLYDWWHIEQVKNVSDEKQAHPCQIPKAVMLRVLQVTPFDGPVMDPFCGAGTTLLAAQDLGRRAIGIESSEEYCEIAANRLRQPRLKLATS